MSGKLDDLAGILGIEGIMKRLLFLSTAPHKLIYK